MIEKLVETLHRGGHSLVVFNGSQRTFQGRGVADLYRLLTTEPAFLQGALVADKVVGKGAAALMILGGVSELYTDVISEPALALFEASQVKVEYGERVPQIQNRARTGFCPVETRCLHALTAEACFPLIEEFMKELELKEKTK